MRRLRGLEGGGRIKFEDTAIVVGDEAFIALIECMRRLGEHDEALALARANRTRPAIAAYGAIGRGDEDPAKCSWESFSRYLFTAHLPDPDLIIRTSGESRLSNFLMLQGAYSELYFSPVPWPEFRKEHLAEAVACYQRRERRYGRTGDQLHAGPARTVAMVNGAGS